MSGWLEAQSHTHTRKDTCKWVRLYSVQLPYCLCVARVVREKSHKVIRVTFRRNSSTLIYSSSLFSHCKMGRSLWPRRHSICSHHTAAYLEITWGSAFITPADVILLRTSCTIWYSFLKSYSDDLWSVEILAVCVMTPDCCTGKKCSYVLGY